MTRDTLFSLEQRGAEIKIRNLSRRMIFARTMNVRIDLEEYRTCRLTRGRRIDASRAAVRDSKVLCGASR